MSVAVTETNMASTREGVLAGRRILIIVENLPVPFDRRVWQEAGALRDAGAEIAVICPATAGYEARYELLDGIHIYRHPLPTEASGALGYLIEYGAALFWEFVLACRVFFERGFDVIHACSPPDLLFLVALPFRLFGKKFVFDHHDISPELFEAKFGRKGPFWRLLVTMERLSFACADMSIATNESYRRIATQRGGMKAENVHVVRSGPDLKRIKHVPAEPAWRNGRRFMVGYVGVMGEQEGIDLLLEAVSTIVKRGRTDIQFCLVGSGPSMGHYKALSADMGLAPYVTFTGRAPDRELLEILSTADICINPDRVNPMNDLSTMNKIIEYMALGKPIVQFDVAEGRFSAGEASLYAKPNDPVDMADKIEALLASPDDRERMGRFGRERVERELSWAHQAPRIVAAYEGLLRR
jgi:glycosyltransferase involved in cell wall biosynthesis